jgi:uncharacterized protein YjbJ (UPF0337 family)
MNTTKTEGVFDQAKGKVKQAVGETFNNQKLANEGAADQVKGHVKEAWGNVKDTANQVHREDAANIRANSVAGVFHVTNDLQVANPQVGQK